MTTLLKYVNTDLIILKKYTSQYAEFYLRYPITQKLKVNYFTHESRESKEGKEIHHHQIEKRH